MSKEKIEVLSTEKRTFPPSKEFSQKAHIKSMAEYEKLYKQSVEEPEKFWGEMAEKNLTWFKKWDKVLDYDFHKPYIKWFTGGKLNASVNCLDRYINTPTRNKAAIIWEADGGEYKTYTYQQLYMEVNRFANVLKKKGVKKGDRVSIYLPMIPELAISMLACARIGAIHSIVFGGFSAKALMDRIQDCQSSMLITADEGVRGGRFVALKSNADEALNECPTVKNMIVVSRSGNKVNMEPGRDTYWHEEMKAKDIANFCEPEQMDAEDPLFILYTSGSTGKPKGVLHTTAGYMLYTNMTFKWIFDYHDEDIHFCTADIGWVTGHSYIVYGPLSAGATSIMFEGIPTYPDPGRFWDIVDKHRINIFYTAPTAIRALMKEGEKWVDEPRPVQPQGPGQRGRAHQPRSLDVVPQERGPREASDRGHVVADRDRRHPDHAASRRHDHQARLGHPAVLRRGAPGRQGGRLPGRPQRRRLPLHQQALARHAAGHLRRPREQAHQGSLLQPVPGQVLHRRRRARR